MGYKNIEDKRAYHREYMKERRQWLKDHHMCTECGNQDAYTLNGRLRCYDCNEKHNKSNVKNVTEERKERIKQYREQRHVEEFCVRCGKRGFDIPRSERQSYGLCYRCGSPLDGQLKTDGEKSKLCSECYNKAPKPPKIRIVYAPTRLTQKSLATWQEVLKKREELLASGTYDYIPIKLNPMAKKG